MALECVISKATCIYFLREGLTVAFFSKAKRTTVTNTEQYCAPAWFQVNLLEMVLTEQEENWFTSLDLRMACLPYCYQTKLCLLRWQWLWFLLAVFWQPWGSLLGEMVTSPLQHFSVANDLVRCRVFSIKVAFLPVSSRLWQDRRTGNL